MTAAEAGRNTAFLAISPESFGIVPDAKPSASDGMIAAASGCMTGGGSGPLVGLPGGGVEHVLSECFPMLPNNAVTADIIRSTFGPCEEPAEHLLTRCCAAAAEAVTLQFFNRPAQSFSEADGSSGVERACHELTSSLQMALDGLCTLLSVTDERRTARETAAKSAAVSVGACRVLPGSVPGSYRVDVVTAGGFRLFLLDSEGLSLIDVGRSGPVSTDPEAVVAGRSLLLEHPAPFALVLLSEGAFDFTRAAREDAESERIHRLHELMRLEERILRAILTAGSLDSLGTQALQTLGGLAAGQGSASGAFLFPAPESKDSGTAFEDFRHVCRLRSVRLEELSVLLADAGEDTVGSVRSTCADCERNFARSLFRKRPEIEAKLSERLAELIHNHLSEDRQEPEVEEWGPCPADSRDQLHRLTRTLVSDVYRRCDSVNVGDRIQIDKNRALIDRTLREHWVTLRPLLCGEGSPLTDDLSSSAREEGSRRYEVCADMSRRLEAMLEARRAALSALTDSLTRAKDALTAGAADWTTGRGDENMLYSLLDSLSGDTADRAARIRNEWPDGMAAYRRLLKQYLRERESLFSFDTQAEDPAMPERHAVFGSTFAAMTAGSLPAEDWAACLSLLSGSRDMDAYVDLFRVLPVISDRIGTLEHDVRKRDAERACIRELTEQSDWTAAVLRAAVYEDTAYGDDIGTLIDESVRAEYRSVVSRWREDNELYERRCAALNEAVTAASRYGSLTV